MKAKGHQQIAETAGIPLLQQALGKNKKSLNALYVGNWLSDVGQAIDPVSHALIAQVLKKKLDSIKKFLFLRVEELTAAAYVKERGKILYSINEQFRDLVTAVEEELIRHIHLLFIGYSDERNYLLATFLRGMIFLKGYFKFVHPDPFSDEPRMNFECYYAIFGEQFNLGGAKMDRPAEDRPGQFNQYYPHEHYDRPEMLPPEDPAIYSPGKQVYGHETHHEPDSKVGLRAGRTSNEIEPDMYSYLRDDIEMTAGLLAEVDQEFREFFKKSIDDNDVAWHLTLAKLGHALHQVEDFFAHTNWAELAATQMGEQFLKEKILISPTLQLIYQRRMLRFYDTPFLFSIEHPPEEWVVSGYFDLWDTIISILHLTQRYWNLGIEAGDIHIKVNDAREAIDAVDAKTIFFQFERLFEDTFEFITDYDRAVKNDDNKIANSLKELFKPNKRIFRPAVTKKIAQTIIERNPIFREVPKVVAENFIQVIVEGTRAYEIKEKGYSLYEAIKNIREFLLGPTAWIAAFVKNWLTDFVVGQGKEVAVFYANELFYELLGSRRIGCHSLLAKDHGSDAEPCYEQAFNCAIAVHWYIVKTLLRWQDPALQFTTKKEVYVNWLELLEFFLRNPLPPKIEPIAIEVPGTLIHTVKHREQLKSKDPAFSLEDLFRETAVEPKKNFTWRTIADENFCTTGMDEKEAQGMINAILKHDAFGVAVEPPNYAFKPGFKLRIPQQKCLLFLRPPPDEKQVPWYKAIFEKDWTVVQGYEFPKPTRKFY